MSFLRIVLKKHVAVYLGSFSLENEFLLVEEARDRITSAYFEWVAGSFNKKKKGPARPRVTHTRDESIQGHRNNTIRGNDACWRTGAKTESN